MTIDEIRKLPRKEQEEELRKMQAGRGNITEMQPILSEDELNRRMEFMRILRENPRYDELSRIPPAQIPNNNQLPTNNQIFTPDQPGQLPITPPQRPPITTMPIQTNPAAQLEGERLAAYNNYLARSMPMMAAQNTSGSANFGNLAPRYTLPATPPRQSPVQMFNQPAGLARPQPTINRRSFARQSFRSPRPFG